MPDVSERPKDCPAGGKSACARYAPLAFKAGIVIALIGALVYAYQVGWLQVFFQREHIQAFLDSLGPFGFIGLIVLQVAQVVIAPIPGEITGLMGGYMYGPVLGTIVSTI